MIPYDHGRWGIYFLFKARGSVFPKALIWTIPSTTLSIILFYTREELGYQAGGGSTGIAMTSVAAFVSILGFMVVFRSNQAWFRYWEGADLLQKIRGQWVGATSSLLAFCSKKPEKAKDVQNFEQLIARLMSLLYGTALSSLSSNQDFPLLNLTGLDSTFVDNLMAEEDGNVKIELIVHWIQRSIIDGVDRQFINVAPPILGRVFNELSEGVEKVAAARKIKDIPFPFHYAQMLGVMLWVYTFGAPAMSAYLMSTAYGCAGSTFLNVFVLWCVNYLSTEIEQPFGDDPNDLPMFEEMQLMNRSLKMLLSSAAHSLPTYDENADGQQMLLQGSFTIRCSGEAQIIELATDGPAKGGAKWKRAWKHSHKVVPGLASPNTGEKADKKGRGSGAPLTPVVPVSADAAAAPTAASGTSGAPDAGAAATPAAATEKSGGAVAGAATDGSAAGQPAVATGAGPPGGGPAAPAGGDGAAVGAQQAQQPKVAATGDATDEITSALAELEADIGGQAEPPPAAGGQAAAAAKAS